MDLKKSLFERKEKCFLCKWILEDLEKHDELTDWTPNQGPYLSEPLFPKSGKLEHLKLEKFIVT